MKRATTLAAAFTAAAAATLVLMSASSVAAGSMPTLTLALTKNTVTVGGSKVSGAVDVVTTVSGEASDSRNGCRKLDDAAVVNLVEHCRNRFCGPVPAFRTTI